MNYGNKTKLKKLANELDADFRNKLTYPRVLLRTLLESNHKLEKKEIERAVKDIDKALNLTKKLFLIFSEKDQKKPDIPG